MARVKHPFQSAKGDGPDSTRVRPSAWNADHDILFDNASVVLGKDQSGDGAGQEIPVVVNDALDDGTLWTGDKTQSMIDAAVAAAIAALNLTPPGTIVPSINGNMPGFVPLNGSSIGPTGSGATFTGAHLQTLYNLIWNNIPTYPIGAGRGASAAADWTALKTISLPNSAGATVGAAGVGLMSGMWLSVVGEASHQLTTDEIPSHVHSVSQPAAGNFGGGVAGGGSVLQEAAPAPYNTNPAGGGGFHNNIQPTLIAQVWWIKY